MVSVVVDEFNDTMFMIVRSGDDEDDDQEDGVYVALCVT